MKELLALLMVLFCTVAGASGAEHYVRSGATGTGRGVNCTNAYSGFGTGAGQINPASMISGDAYWLLAGTYGSVTFSSVNVTIRAATAASHGAASDCGSYYGVANFSSVFVMANGITIDGQKRNSDWISGYNIVINYSAGDGALNLGKSPTKVSNVAVHYVKLNGSGNINTADYSIWIQGGASNIQVDHSYLYNPGNANVQDNDGSIGLSNGEVFEYNYFCCNHGDGNHHSEGFATMASNMIVRKNVFQDIQSTALIASPFFATAACSNWEVYGNLIFRTDAFAALTIQGDWGDGIVANMSCNPFTGHVYFYNNTIANIRTACRSCAISSSAVSGGSMGWPGGATILVENNLWWNSVNPSDAPGRGIMLGYNSYFGGTKNSGDKGAHKQVSARNPFVNYSLNSIAGYQLSADTAAGLSLASPYNVDILDVPRGVNGTWDRGALQIDGP